MSDSFYVVIPAAGGGTRFGAKTPKQYLRVGGKTILEHTISIFLRENWVKQLVIPIALDDHFFYQLPVANHPKVVSLKGQNTRAHSVANATTFLMEHAHENDWVLVHDAVRPCLHRNDLNNLIDTLQEDTVGGILAAQVQDTMKQGKTCIDKTLPREYLWHALTPQMFRLKLVHTALMHCLDEGVAITDDASALEYCGHKVKLVQSLEANPKLTYPRDKDYIAMLLAQKQKERVIA